MPDRETDRFLSALYEQARQDGEDPEDVAKRIHQNARGVSRRELLGGAGALGLGAAMGGSGAMAATGKASADASTSDSDGNVGLPSDPVDVFAEGIDSNSVSTDRIATRSRPSSAIVYNGGDGNFYADGDDLIDFGPDLGVVTNSALTAIQADGSVTWHASIGFTGDLSTKVVVPGSKTLRGESIQHGRGGGFVSKASGASLSELIRLDGDDAALENINIEGAKGDGTGTDGVYSAGNNTTIKETRLKNFDGRGAFLDGLENRFMGGIIDSCAKNGLEFGEPDCAVGGGAQIAQSGENNIQVTNNSTRIENVNVWSAGFSNVKVSSNNCLITSVRANNATRDNFEIRAPSWLSNVHAHSAGRRGIGLYASANLSGGVSRKNSEAGVSIRASDVTVSGGFIARNNGQGVGDFDNKGSGIWSNSDNVVIGPVRSYDDQATKTQTNGLYIDSGTDHIVSGNYKGNNQTNYVDNGTGTVMGPIQQ